MDWAAVTGVAVALITAVAGWAGARVTARSQERTTRAEANGPDWDRFMARVQSWTNHELEKRDEEISELRSEVGTLRDQLEVWKSRYFVAVDHIRAWRLRHPESVDDMPLPEALKREF